VDGNGKDSFTLNAKAVNIAAAAMVDVKVDGCDGADHVDIDYDGQILGTLKVVARGGTDGANGISENITAEAGSTGNVYARVRAGTAKDHLTLNVYDKSGSGGHRTLADLDAVIMALSGDVLH
jgi:hypothetical protein